MQLNKPGFLIATAVSTLLAATACGSDDMKENTAANTEAVRCQGINECKGMGECAGPTGQNECQGYNECKGMGWLTVDSEKACTDKGGTVIEG